jgi:hypothetical protein
MRYDPERHHRRSIRLRGYDYRAVGAYFITIVVQDRARLFGEVVDGEMRLNDAGRMVERWWLELNRRFPHVLTDAYVVMPNHFHGIVVIHSRPPDTTAPPDVGADLRVCPYIRGRTHRCAPTARPPRFNGRPRCRGRPACLPQYACLPRFRGRTRRCAPTDDCAMVQNHDHQRIHPYGKTRGMDAVSGTPVAAQLLRTHHPQRTRP